MKPLKAFLAGNNEELLQIIRELDSQNRLKVELTTSLENGVTVLYTGGELADEELTAFLNHGARIYDISLLQKDAAFAQDKGFERISYTAFVKTKKGVYYPFLKRLVDIIISGLGIVISAPVMLVVAILVRIKLGSPVTFSQARPGKHEKLFYVHKFRSMSNARDENGELLPDSQRLTRFGKILRATSLDELPQLFSIFTGKMSLIGPRPQSFENVYFMNAKQRLRHIVTPGLTGLSQVNGRNAIPWSEKIQWDLEYVNNRITAREDAMIFIKTVWSVLLQKDITQEGSVSTESVGEFRLRTGSIDLATFDKMHHEAVEMQHENLSGGGKTRKTGSLITAEIWEVAYEAA